MKAAAFRNARRIIRLQSGIVSRLRQLMIVAAMATAFGLMASMPGAAQSDGASTKTTLSAKFAGAFVNWGERGREYTLREWEDWLNRPRSSVLSLDFYAHSTWADFLEYRWVPALWKSINPDRNVVWSFPLTVKGTPLADVANGSHDSEFESAAKAIADAQPNAIIRIGWEMNSISTPWFAEGQEADYIRAFRHVVGIFRSHSSGFTYDWCPSWGRQDLPADLVYPGDDVVDYIGLDVYDFKYDGSAEQRWNDRYLKAEFGLEWHRSFAGRHGKKMSFPEWGVGQFGDNPLFVQKMHDWFVQNEDRIAYAAYFDVDGDWPTQIDNGQFPKSQLLFRELFRRTGHQVQ
jgi:hypothetical protein